MKDYKNLIAIIICLVSPAVFAHAEMHSSIHVDEILNDLLMGFSHPMSGIDHIIVLLLAGFFVSRCENKKTLMFGAVALSPVLAYGIDVDIINISFISGFMLASATIIYSGCFFGKQLSDILNTKTKYEKT